MKYFFELYCKEYENIENYHKALADNFNGWECHHKLETHTSDGERRLVDITRKELIALDTYYNRPSEELIFLTKSEHMSLHRIGKHHSEETLKKMSETHKGHSVSEETKKKLSEAAKNMSDETKKKMSEAKKGNKLSEEHKKKISEGNKGKHDGENNSFYGKHHTEEAKKRISEKSKGNAYAKGMHWFNNGKENKYCYECPEGFVPGMLRK